MPVNASGIAKCDVCLKVHYRKTFYKDGEHVSLCSEHDPNFEKPCAGCKLKFRPNKKEQLGNMYCYDCRRERKKRIDAARGMIDGIV